MQELVVELQVVPHLDSPAFERLCEWWEVTDLEGVYDERLLRSCELEQAHPSVAGGEGRGLDVHADDFGALQSLRDGGKVFCGRNETVVLGAFLHHSILAGRGSFGSHRLPVRGVNSR